MTTNRRPVDQAIQDLQNKFRRIRKLKNRRDTLVQNIVAANRRGHLEAAEINRIEVAQINRDLEALGVW